MKAATKWGPRPGLLSRDPLVGYKRPRTSSSPMSAWSTREARSFLQAVAGDRLEFAWGLLLTRGLRRGELCGLKWMDVNLDGRALQLVRTRVIVDNEAVESIPKTELGRRPISLDDHLVAPLRRHKTTQAAERLAAGGAYEDGG